MKREQNIANKHTIRFKTLLKYCFFVHQLSNKIVTVNPGEDN